MSTHYYLDAALIEAGVVVRLKEPGASFRTYNSTIQEIIWPVVERMNVKPLAEPFPWFESRRMFDGSDVRPQPEHCFRPQEVLQDLHWIEREVSKHPKRYPAVWTFAVPAGPDRAACTHESLAAYYNGRAVLLFGEGKDCWAKETTPGPREGIHHKLTGEASVSVGLAADSPPVTVAIHRSPLSRQYSEVMTGLKRVCAFAVQHRVFVLPQYVH